jgi:protein phosphatase
MHEKRNEKHHENHKMKQINNLAMAGVTDPGRIRSNNEDNYAIVPEIGLAVVADGMGGHLAGEVASGIAVDLVTRNLTETFATLPTAKKSQKDAATDSPEVASVRDAIRMANSAIFETSTKRPECAGMGSTIVVAVFYTNKICIAHVGDSRLYRFRNDTLEQITEDHSMVQELLSRGFITEEEARASTNKNVVTRALGVDADVQPDISEQTLKEGDVYLLCSDGLTDVLSDAEIRELLIKYHADLDGAIQHLVAEANIKGGPDNVSVVLVRTGKRFVRDKKAVKELQSLKSKH